MRSMVVLTLAIFSRSCKTTDKGGRSASQGPRGRAGYSSLHGDTPSTGRTPSAFNPPYLDRTEEPQLYGDGTTPKKDDLRAQPFTFRELLSSAKPSLFLFGLSRFLGRLGLCWGRVDSVLLGCRIIASRGCWSHWL